MKVYHTQEEVEKDIKDEVLVIKGDVKFECAISISASIQVTRGNINAQDINARDIIAWNINARDINAGNINAGDINAGNINAGDINARDINAWNINARDINARDINAGDISYYAFCCVYRSIGCFSIKAHREKHQEPLCLDGKLEIKQRRETSLSGKKVSVELDGKKYTATID